MTSAPTPVVWPWVECSLEEFKATYKQGELTAEEQAHVDALQRRIDQPRAIPAQT